MLWPKRYCKETMGVHYWKKHKENLKWVECKLGCNEGREVLKDNIKQYTVYAKNKYYMESEKLEGLLSTEHHDDVQATLKEIKEKRVETDR